MKASKLIRFLLIPSFLLAGCEFSDLAFWKKKDQPSQQEEQGQEEGGEETPQEPVDITFKTSVNVKMEKLLNGAGGFYNIEYQFSDAFFKEDAEVYSKDLSMLSLGAALSATYEEWVSDFLTTCKFENHVLHDYDKEPTKDTLGYALAHKEIDGSELFTVLIRGHQYKAEWQNNFIIGEEGDHEGWLARSTELYSALSSYIATYKGEKTIKLWIAGYSRAGAISNLLSSLILRSDGINVSAKNMYVYTFEAPSSISEEHVHEYKNIHNIINSGDLITYIPSTKYGLSRIGEDYEIYDENLSTLIKSFDSQIDIPEFVEFEGGGKTIKNDVECAEYLISTIFDYNGDASKSAQTREEYVERYQAGLSYSIGLMFALSPTTRSEMMASLTNDPQAMLAFFDTSGTTLANLMKPYLDKDHIDYNDTELVAACAVLVGAFSTIFSGFLGLYLGSAKTNITRNLNMHYPEVTYCLLQNAHLK